MNKDTKTLTTKELAELLHTTTEELERRGKEAKEINERIEKQYNEAQKDIEKQVIEKKKKSKTQMMKELQKELKTEGIKKNLSTHSLVYQVRKPSEDGLLQDSRRLQQNPYAVTRRGKARRHCLFCRKPCAGSGAVRHSSRDSFRDLHAGRRAHPEGGSHTGLRC